MRTVLSHNCSIIALFILSLIIVGIHVGVSAWQLSLFCIVNITGILLPGFFLVRLSGFHFKNTTSTLLTAYCIGFAATSMMYATLLLCGIQHLSGWLLWIVSAICLIALFVKKIRYDLTMVFIEANRVVFILQVLFLTLLAFCYILFQRPLSPVDITGYQDIPYDQMYWMKNCVAASKGFPLPELSISGLKMYWHMFSCFNIALFHFSTNIEFFHLCFSLSYVWHILLLLGSAYVLANELLNTKKYVIIAMILTLLCSSAEYHTDILYLVHLWYCTMGTPEAIASELIGFLLLLKTIEGKQVNWKFVPLTTLMTSATVGYKSPVGIVLLVGVGCTLLILTLRNWSALIPSIIAFIIITLLALTIIKVFVASDQTLVSQYSNNHITLTFRTATQAGFMRELSSLLVNGVGMNIYIVALLFAIPCILLAHPIMVLLSILLVILFIKRSRINYSDEGIFYIMIPLLIMCMVGVMAFLALTHYGFAQSYFIYAIIPLAVLLSSVIIEKFFINNDAWNQLGIYVFTGCSILIMPICAFTYVQDKEFKHAPAKISLEGTSLTANEWKGLIWAREHLPESAVIVTNKVLAPTRGNRSYITSSYAEHQVYLEGYISANIPDSTFIMDRIRRVAKYFSGDLKARDELHEEGVTHVIIFKSLADVNRLPVNWSGRTRILVFNPLSERNIKERETLYENEEIKLIAL